MLLWIALALAAPEDALDPVSARFFAQATADEEAGKWSSAEAGYKLVHGNDATFLPASLGLARALLAQGHADQAEALYRSLGLDPDAVEALARLVEPRSPAEALGLWTQLETLRLGDPGPWCAEARLRAPLDEGLEAALSAWDRCAVLSGTTAPDLAPLDVILDVLAPAGVALDPDKSVQATALLDDAIRRWPAVEPLLQPRRDRLEIERSARDVVLGGSVELSGDDTARIREARALLVTDPARARAIAESIVGRAPRSAEAHAVLSDAAWGIDWSDAEVHALLARDLDPDDASNHLRVARILHAAYAGRRDAEALTALRQAAALRPDEPAILLQLAELESARGEWDRAEAALVRWLQINPDTTLSAAVQARLEGLRRAPPPARTLPPVTPPGIPDEALAAWRIARVYLDRGDLAGARAELDVALASAPKVPALMNLDARLRRESGDVKGAIRAWEASLAVDPGQGDVQLALGETLDAKGEPESALEHYRRAAEAGEADAHFFLARSADTVGDWQTVQKELQAFDSAGGHGSLYAVAAGDLAAKAHRHVLTVRAVGAGLLVAVAGLPLTWLLWRRGGVGLRQMLDQAPGSWHDAARILAAVRHEVLKHNTTVLPDIAGALEHGDGTSWEAWRGGAGDLLARFDGYVGALESLGAQHGVRLAADRDPILAPMRASLKALVRASRRGRAPRPADLRAHSEVLNGEGYTALGTLVTEICILPVTAEHIEKVYARVAAEPGFGGDTAPLTVSGEPGQVRLFRGDLEDILANLFRNALAAGATRVAVVLGEDSDPITGHAWFEIRVEDDAPGQLTTAMIRGRYISRGLGLAVDMLNRHGGTIRVDAPAGAPGARPHKAVVVQLPSVEAASVEVEWK